MDDLVNVQVGDKLFVKSGYHGKGHIAIVDRITPSGRIITKAGEFNPNGRKRGQQGWDRTWARPATEDDIAGIFRLGLVRKLEMFRQWEKLSAEDLKAAADIITKYSLPSAG